MVKLLYASLAKRVPVQRKLCPRKTTPNLPHQILHLHIHLPPPPPLVKLPTTKIIHLQGRFLTPVSWAYLLKRFAREKLCGTALKGFPSFIVDYASLLTVNLKGLQCFKFLQRRGMLSLRYLSTYSSQWMINILLALSIPDEPRTFTFHIKWLPKRICLNCPTQGFRPQTLGITLRNNSVIRSGSERVSFLWWTSRTAWKPWRMLGSCYQCTKPKVTRALIRFAVLTKTSWILLKAFVVISESLLYFHVIETSSSSLSHKLCFLQSD